MAAKFSMANPASLFGVEAHAEASDRLQQAAEELKVKHEHQKRQDELEQQQQAQELARQQQRQQQQERAAKEAEPDDRFIRSHAASSSQQDAEGNMSEEDDEELLDWADDQDPEFQRLREQRMEALRRAHQEKQQLLAKGHGEYREITQDEFLKEVTSSAHVAVHFYHRDFERCKIMDMHLKRLAALHIPCKFLKIDAEKAPFFVQKLVIRVLPTIVCFHDGVAYPDRVVGFDGLAAEAHDDETQELQAFGSRAQHQLPKDSDEFPTTALARRLARIGVIQESDIGDSEER